MIDCIIHISFNFQVGYLRSWFPGWGGWYGAADPNAPGSDSGHPPGVPPSQSSGGYMTPPELPSPGTSSQSGQESGQQEPRPPSPKPQRRSRSPSPKTTESNVEKEMGEYILYLSLVNHSVTSTFHVEFLIPTTFEACNHKLSEKDLLNMDMIQDSAENNTLLKRDALFASINFCLQSGTFKLLTENSGEE